MNAPTQDEWALYMVTAALKCASDDKLSTSHPSADEAKHSVLKTLNWFEAHDEYEWPNFGRLGYDFSQVMRLRRALVQDIFSALEQAGNLKIGAPGTPDSIADRRANGRGSRQMNTRKRLCRREAERHEEDTSEQSNVQHDENSFAMDVMTELVARSYVDATVCMEKRDQHTFADLLHDRLVDVWEKPQQEDGNHETLQQKAEAWAQYKRSHPPRSSQRDRTPTPPVAGQSSLATGHQASAAAKLPWDLTGGRSGASVNWALTHSIG